MNTIDFNIDSNELDELTRSFGRGGQHLSTYNAFWGHNHASPGVTYTPSNQEQQGLTFFTKPMLNLAYNNILSIRRFEHLLDPDPKKMDSIIRASLCPVIKGANLPYVEGRNARSDLVDDNSPFIHFLSNKLLSLSGWPDPVMDFYTDSPAMNKTSAVYIDSEFETNEVNDLQATFANMDGSPILHLFNDWLYYMGAALKGRVNPYPAFMINKTIDSQTCIWRLVLDKSGEYLSHIACTFAAFPMAVPIGGIFNYDSSSLFVSESNQISIPFKCLGFEYNDPILIGEFNRLVEMFNPAMRDQNRNEVMIRLEGDDFHYFNHRAYPRIETGFDSSEKKNRVSWWTYKQFYSTVKSQSPYLR